MASNMSNDLVWELTNKYNSYMVKQRSGGRILLSRDPLNLTNRHARRHAGLAADKAVGIQAPPPTKDGPSTGVVLLTKNPTKTNQPAKSINRTHFGGKKSTRKTYKGIVAATAKRDYRADLRSQTVARASAIKRSQGKPRVVTEKKPRGKKAKKAAEKESAS